MPNYQSIDSLLNAAQVAISNAMTNAQIQEHLLEFGYTPERLQHGKALYEAARAAYQRQQADYGDQKNATASLKQTWDIADKTYMRFVKVARVAFKGNAGVATRLGIEGARKQNLSGWLTQANQFYTNALNSPDLVNQLREYGITTEKLLIGHAEVREVEAANLTQKQEKGDAQSATQTKDKALDALQDWMSDFIAIARLALENDRQLLEGLGIFAAS